MKAYKTVGLLGLAAAVIYNSWPLGYWLNPNVVRIGLASDLQMPGQPYNQVFTIGDVVCGLVVIIAVAFLFKFATNRSRSLTACLLGLATFGLFTAVSALVSPGCGADIQRCGYQPGQPFGGHDLTGMLAALGLFWALCFSLRVFNSHRRLWRTSLSLLVLWSFWGIWFLYATLFGNYQHPQIQNLLVQSQQTFLALSGAAVWLLFYGHAKIQQIESLKTR